MNNLFSILSCLFLVPLLASDECHKGGRYSYTQEDVIYANKDNCSKVYRAVDSETQDLVLLKEYSWECPAENKQILLFLVNQEVDMLKSVQNVPGVTTLIEAFPGSRGGQCVVLKWIDAIDLDNYVYGNLSAQEEEDGFEKLNALSSVQVKRIFGELSTTLLKINRVGVTHRDIKPENIMLKHDGEVLLVDFGYAAHINDRVNPIGSPLFLPPEQTNPHLYSQVHHDWWSLAVTGLCMLNPGKRRKQIYEMLVNEKYETEYEDAHDLLGVIVEMLQREQSSRLAGTNAVRRLTALSIIPAGEVTNNIQSNSRPISLADINAAAHW